MKPASLSSSSSQFTRRGSLKLLSASALGMSLPKLAGAQENPPKGSGRLLVTNKGDRTLSIIDPVTNKQIAAVPERGVTGHEVAASLDGKRAFVPIFGNAGVGSPGTDGSLIQVIDLEKQAVVDTIDFGRGVRPHCPVMCRKSGLLYVTTEIEKSVTIIDPKTLKIIGSIPTGSEQSHMLAVSSDGKRGYTSNVGPGTVSALDLEQKKLIKVINVSPLSQRISLSVDDKLAFTSDQLNPRLAVIDTATNEVKEWAPLPSHGYGTAATPDGNFLVIALININKVGLLDLKTLKIVKTVDVPKAPQYILVRPDGKMAYASCDASKQVAAISLPEFKVEALIDAGKTADGMAWAASA